MSLRKQTFSGLAWTLTDTILLKGGAFVAQLVLARLLGPSEFGLIGMIAIFIAVGTSLVDSGLSSSLVRTKNVSSIDYNTVFFTNLGISCFIYLLIFFLAPIIANFYSQPILIAVIRVYCLSFVISAFSTIQMTIYIKEMKFRRLTLINIPGTIFGIGTGILLGYNGYGVWSIVFMYLVTQLSLSILLWIGSDWKPSLIFSKDKLKFHFLFGYKLMLSGLLNTTFDNIYNILIGKFYNIKTLGYYERAYLFNQYPVTMLTNVIGKVTYPMFASIQDEKEKIAAVYRRILQLTFFLTAPLMFCAAALAKPLFTLVLGTQWLPAVPFFQILCFSSMLYPIHAFNLNILKVFGRSDLFLKLEIIKKIVIVLAVMVSFRFGIFPLVWSAVVSSFIALLINTHYSSPMINYSVKAQLLDMLPSFLLAGSVGLMIYFIFDLFSESVLSQLFISSLIAALSYLLLNRMLKTPSFQTLITLIFK